VLLVVSTTLTTGFFVSTASGHGLVENPPSRNWYCGAITKPDEVLNGNAQYPECGDAFANDFNGGYQFMSVLTHDVGRAGVKPLPENVCGFSSETFNGGETPWDQAADWPTSPMGAGKQDFTWNIQWGPHYDDTEEFRFWITKPGFQYQRNRKLTWNDFENTEFCAHQYDDSRPTGNPAVAALKSSSQFTVSCNVPQRQGRHIIYAEWGRNQYTLERFHSCIDVEFSQTNPKPEPSEVEAAFNLDVANFAGAGTLLLDGSASAGEGLSYNWSVSAADRSVYSIDNANAAVTTLSLAEPSAAQNVSVTLTVSSTEGSDSTSDTLLHEPQYMSAWVDLGVLSNTAIDYASGDKLSVRIVSGDGRDTFYPNPPLTLNDSNARASQWPITLANAVNAAPSSIAVGLLNRDDEIAAVADATSNRVYAIQGSDVVSAFLQYDANDSSSPTPPIDTPPAPSDGRCIASLRSGNNPWWAGIDVASNGTVFSLDFSNTGLDLTTVRIDSGGADVVVSGQKLTMSAPQWISLNAPVYFGLGGDNNAALATLTAPSCLTSGTTAE